MPVCEAVPLEKSMHRVKKNETSLLDNFTLKEKLRPQLDTLILLLDWSVKLKC